MSAQKFPAQWNTARTLTDPAHAQAKMTAEAPVAVNPAGIPAVTSEAPVGKPQ